MDSSGCCFPYYRVAHRHVVCLLLCLRSAAEFPRVLLYGQFRCAIVGVCLCHGGEHIPYTSGDKEDFHPKENEKVSNADAIIGKEGRVSELISGTGYGRVAIDGDDWKAQSQDGMTIPVGSKVRVVSRDSIIITVAPL